MQRVLYKSTPDQTYQTKTTEEEKAVARHIDLCQMLELIQSRIGISNSHNEREKKESKQQCGFFLVHVRGGRMAIKKMRM